MTRIRWEMLSSDCRVANSKQIKSTGNLARITEPLGMTYSNSRSAPAAPRRWRGCGACTVLQGRHAACFLVEGVEKPTDNKTSRCFVTRGLTQGRAMGDQAKYRRARR
jgi:hypothetical protein